LITVELSARLHAQPPAGQGRGAVPQAEALFTSAQAVAGKAGYERNCAGCHGASVDDGNSAPPLRGAAFLGKYAGKPAADLFTYVVTKMPPGNPGSLGGGEYARLWRSREAAALEVDLKRGVSTAAGLAAVRTALRSRPGLWIRPAAVRAGEAEDSARQGLHTLGQISTLLIVAAALAVAAALSASVWQRRIRLASLKIQGYRPDQLWAGLLMESATMLGIGALLGAVVGIYGHALASRWLTAATGFPAPFAFAGPQILFTLGLITAITLAVMALPGLAAARVPARVSLQE